ncbi:putative porin [Vogesella indigofera]|uniref:Putative porin n=1 Tax=Vogesella indigofera TaxID=45465 RepID=A0A495BN43_VOGIN|nr:porin [Vogesella indigofera]RKQ63072.1 putative porin [Vogesella indigofera]
MKKLIVLATLAALPAAAMADVVISGNLAVGITNTKVKDTGSVTTEDRTSGEIKFAGKEDLGNGLKSIWQIASRINLSDKQDNARDNAWSGRDSFVGLQGDFGTVTLGNIYHMPTSGAMAIFEDNSASFKSDLYDQGDRINSTISYKSPTVAGFTAVVQHSFGSSTANEAAKKHQQALSLAYEGEGFSVSYDGTRAKEDANNTSKLHELNASVSLDALTLMAGYAQGKDSDGKRRGYGLAASYTMGNITPKLGFWKEGDFKNADGTKDNDGHKAYAVGVEYALSKRTRAGVELAKANYDDNATADVRTATVYLGTKF